MKITRGKEVISWIGAWPAKKTSRRVVAVLAGTAHSGLGEVGAEYIATHHDQISGADYDWYRLPANYSIWEG